MKPRGIVEIVVLLICCALVGCASNVHLNLDPGAQVSTPTGTLVVKLSEPLEKVNVTIDGNLVCEDKYTERIEVKGVAAGEHEVRITGSGSFRKEPLAEEETVNIKAGKQTGLTVAVPAHSGGYYVYLVAMIVVPLIPSWIILGRL